MVSRMTPRELRRLADEVFDDLYLALMGFPALIRQRGQGYVEDGRVGPLVFEAGRTWATVHGATRYVTSWRLDESGWRSTCTCPAGPECKHAFALGTELIALRESDAGIASGDLDLLLMRLPPGRVLAAAGDVAARSSTATPPPTTSTTFEALREARDPAVRRMILQQLLRDAGIRLDNNSGTALGEALSQRDPELLGWWLAQEIVRWSDGSLPPALEPFRERPDLARRAALARRPEIEQQLTRWANSRTHRAERRLRLLLELTPAPRGGYRIGLETRLSSARLQDEPRTLDQLRALQSQVRSNRALLSFEHSVLLDAIVVAGTRGRNVTLAHHESNPRRSPIAELLHAILPSPDVSWSHHLPADGVTRAGLSPGALVRFDPAPARLLPSFDLTDTAEEARLELMAVWPDGRRRAYTQVAVVFTGAPGHADLPSFLVSEGVVHPLVESPPAEVLHLMALMPSVPVARKGSAPLVRALAAALHPGADSLAALTAVHAVEPVALLQLDEDDRLQIRLIAHTPGVGWPPEHGLPESARVFEYVPAGQWEVIGTPDKGRAGREGLAEIGVAMAAEPAVPAPAAVANEGSGGDTGAPSPPASPGGSVASVDAPRAWLHAPEPAQVGPLVEWLRSIDAQPAGEAASRERDARPRPNVGWWVKLTARTVPVVAEAWQHRPANVRWLGNRAALALLGPGRRLVPRIRARRSGVDLLAVSVDWEAEGFSITDADLARLRSSGQPWVRLSGGWARRDALDVHDQAMEVLADLGVEAGSGEQQLTLWQLAQTRSESLDALERMGIDSATVDAVRDLRRRVATFTGLPRCPVPPGFRGELRPYQRDGLDFLAYTASLGMGAVLADDMGLGKTVQALAWLLHMREITPAPGPALVLCPASVAHNWEREASQFAPGLRVRLLTSGADRHQQIEEADKADLLITNYALLRRDAERWRRQKLFAVIADEAQQIKNPAAAVSRIASELHAEHRLALTGTPLENRALDLWSIVRFVNPGYLGDQRSFTQRFDHADAPPHARRLLTAKLRPILMRRLKKDVAPELPERIEERRDCEMTTGQRKLYLAELARARDEIASLAEAGGVRRHKIEILAALTRLRQICCHPQLAGGRASLGSGKFEALFDLLEPLLAEGHKVLLFSQFVRALELVRTEMKQRGIAHHLLTGSTTHRPAVIRAFEQDTEPCVFLISLRAGGTGLNLTAASYVVLLDPWWNPAVEAQAIDRTHRIGQDRTVIAYRLLMQGTIEEKIWELQQRKSDLVRNVLGEDGFARMLDREALDYLFAET